MENLCTPLFKFQKAPSEASQKRLELLHFHQNMLRQTSAALSPTSVSCRSYPALVCRLPSLRMEHNEADELNLAFSSDLQACKMILTSSDIGRLLAVVESYREGSVA